MHFERNGKLKSKDSIITVNVTEGVSYRLYCLILLKLSETMNFISLYYVF